MSVLEFEDEGAVEEAADYWFAVEVGEEEGELLGVGVGGVEEGEAVVFAVVEKLEEDGLEGAGPIVLAEVVEEEPGGAEAGLEVLAGEGGDLVVVGVPIACGVLEAVGGGPGATGAGAHGAEVEKGEATGLAFVGRADDAEPRLGGGGAPAGDGFP